MSGVWGRENPSQAFSPQNLRRGCFEPTAWWLSETALTTAPGLTQCTFKDKMKKRGHTSALLSAFFSKSNMNLADLAGQRPCPLEWRDFACAVRPTPPQYLRKGIACLWAITSSRYRLALVKGSLRSAKAVSLVFCSDYTSLVRENGKIAILYIN